MANLTGKELKAARSALRKAHKAGNLTARKTRSDSITLDNASLEVTTDWHCCMMKASKYYGVRKISDTVYRVAQVAFEFEFTIGGVQDLASEVEDDDNTAGWLPVTTWLHTTSAYA